jgi:hypothetical protein
VYEIESGHSGRALINPTQTVTHMRKKLVAIALAAMATSGVACTDLTTALGSYNITGSYQLRTFNGSFLPTVSYQDNFQQHQLLSETFTIYSDGTYTDDYTVRIFTSSGSSTQDYRDTGTYQQNNTAIQFRDNSTGDVFSGSLNGNTLTITQLGDVYVYQR